MTVTRYCSLFIDLRLCSLLLLSAAPLFPLSISIHQTATTKKKQTLLFGCYARRTWGKGWESYASLSFFFSPFECNVPLWRRAVFPCSASNAALHCTPTASSRRRPAPPPLGVPRLVCREWHPRRLSRRRPCVRLCAQHACVLQVHGVQNVHGRKTRRITQRMT